MKVTGTLTRGGLDDIRGKTCNPYSDVRLNVQKSAEAIVPQRGMSLKEGSTNGAGRAE
jgi:hypothetical protein